MFSSLKAKKVCRHDDSKFLEKEQIFYCGDCGNVSATDFHGHGWDDIDEADSYLGYSAEKKENQDASKVQVLLQSSASPSPGENPRTPPGTG